MSIWRRICNLWWLSSQVNRGSTVEPTLNQILGNQQATIVQMKTPIEQLDI